MNFLAPLMLLGLAAAAVPIVIHLIGRRRAPVRRFAAMDFLLGTNRRVARRLRLREMLLLALRVLVALAIPLVLAKPFVSCSATGPLVARGPQAVVLVVDNSFTMGYRRGGESLFEAAKARARQVLGELGPEADVAVVFTAEGTQAPTELSRDHLRLRDTIDDAELSNRPGDVTLALRRAAALVASSPHTARRVYLFSILPAKAFPPGEPAWAPGSGPELHVFAPTDEPIPNLAVTSLTTEQAGDVGPRGVRVAAEIVNFGEERVVDRGITLRIGARPVARGLISLGPGERGVKQFTATIPGDERAADVLVELDGDGLAIDDRRWIRVELRKDVRVLIVDGDPSAVRHEDETFYLETALRPGDRSDSSMVVTSTTVDELPRRRLADHDVVFLCNVKPLDPARISELDAWVRKGGGLFVSLGDNVDEQAYASMSPLLAQELRAVRDVAPGLSGAERVKRGETIGRIEKTHPVFQVFGARGTGLAEASFWRWFLVSPSASDDRDRQILARLSGGAPLLIKARSGNGRLFLYTSTIDRDWNNLPVHKGYLPLLQQAARHLAQAPTRDEPTQVLVGQAREIAVGEGDTRVEVVAPSGARTVFDKERLEGRKAISFNAAVEPGVYRVTVAGGGTRARPAGDFVANVDPRGSDTRRAQPGDLPDDTPSVAASEGAVKAPMRRVELWHSLAAALLLFLFGEALLARR